MRLIPNIQRKLNLLLKLRKQGIQIKFFSTLTMDGSVDELFYSSLWSDLDVNQRSLWVYGESGEANRPIICLVGLGEDNNNDSPTSMTNSVHKPDSLATQDASSIVLCSESDLSLEESFRSPSNGMVNSGLEVGNVALQYNLAIPTPFSENGDKLRSSLLPYINVGHSCCNYGFETSSFDKDLQTFSPIRQSCPLPCFECVTSVSPHFEKQQINRGLVQEEYVENDLHVSESKHFNFSASVPSKGKQDLRNCALSSFASAPQLMVGMTELLSLPQTKSNICFEECNGAGKPRVRARRGQATDPHSIAERLRREKIADRMRTLQELVPNSYKNKMDKASVLDEIIEYVKFLQLQLKAPKGLSLPSSSTQAANVLASDEIAFRQEVVKLMESDMTLAMQYLQDKGICLMPVDLAAEISEKSSARVCSSIFFPSYLPFLLHQS